MPANITAVTLPALLAGAVERLGKAFEGIAIGRLGAARRRAGHHQVGTLAHGLDHAGFLRGVLDPGPVILGVHGEFDAADLGARVAARLERVADDHRYLVADILARPGRD